MPRFFDLSQRIEAGMTLCPGDPEPRLSPATAIAPPWRVTELHLGSHTGTHLDAPAHFIPAGKTIDQYPISRFIVPGVVVPATPKGDDEPIKWEACAEYVSNLPKDGAIIICTKWDRHWRSERYFRHPFLDAEAARRLAQSGAKLIGIDALSVDSSVQATSHAHAALLGADILIVENLTDLHQLEPRTVYQFSFLPLLLAGVDGSPVRAVAWEI